MKILLDAGHYAKYNQSNVYPQYYEGNMTWKLANYLKDYLEENYVVRVDLTYDKLLTYEPGVYYRGRKASGYDAFYSLHSNATSSSSVTRVVIIRNAYTSKYDSYCKELGDAIKNCMGIKEATQVYYLKSNSGDEYYGVLRGAKSVGVGERYIIEHGFHTNKAVAKWLYSDENLKKLAEVEAKIMAKHHKLEKKVSQSRLYIVRVTSESLNGRKGAGTNFDIECKLTKGTAVTIVDEKLVNGTRWLKTKSGYWISSKYTEFVRYV